METRTIYFDKPGIENTNAVLAAVKQRAKELGIKTILVASTTGFAGAKAAEVLKSFRVVVVSHCTGSAEPNTQELTEENRKIIESKGAIIYTGTHAFSGVDRALHQGGMFPVIPPPHYTPTDLISLTLRVFGHGMKVACAITAMAADAGLVRIDEEVIAIAGSGSGGRGSDTAIVVKPSNAHRFFDLRVKEIICKPR